MDIDKFINDNAVIIAQPCAVYQRSALTVDYINANHLRELLKTHSIVEKCVHVQKGSDAYKELIVSTPDGTQGAYWPEDAVYPLLKALIGVNDE